MLVQPGHRQHAPARRLQLRPRLRVPERAALEVDHGRDELQAGDLVFWAYNTSDPTTIHHVAIWMGNGQIVEARNSGTVVKVSPMNWDGYIGAVRPGG